MKRAVAVIELNLQEVTQLANERSVFEEDRCLFMVSCLYCMSRRPRVEGYVYDDSGIYQLRLPGLVPGIVVLLPVLFRKGSKAFKLHRIKV